VGGESAVRAPLDGVPAGRAAPGGGAPAAAVSVDQPRVAPAGWRLEGTADQAKAARSLLDLDDDVLVALQLQPARGALEAAVPADPTIYRFYEVLQVYGSTIKELIHEEFGDGIMSAINFRLDVRREPDPAGDRVIVVLDGKFLPYQW
jgi:cyanase